MYNGKRAPIEDLPYVVALAGMDAPVGRFNAGTIISKNWVITSSPHLKLSYLQHYRIRAGGEFLNSYFKGSVHRVDKIVFWERRYENSTGPELFSQLALMRVAQPFRFDETRQPIKMFESGEKVTNGKIANISGFGIFLNNHWFPYQLEWAEVPIMRYEECNDLYQAKEGKGIPEGFICGDYKYNLWKNLACYETEGGPVTVDGRLAGVVGTHYGCPESATNPKLYFDVAYLREWIDKHVNLN